MISGYLGSGDAFDEAVTNFAVAYADQTERDHEALVKAVKDGRIHAESDGSTS
jgi:transcription initiation factor TFIID subunit TAF12